MKQLKARVKQVHSTFIVKKKSIKVIRDHAIFVGRCQKSVHNQSKIKFSMSSAAKLL